MTQHDFDFDGFCKQCGEPEDAADKYAEFYDYEDRAGGGKRVNKKRRFDDEEY